MFRGKIIKGVAGFYEVNTHEGLYECKAKGLFRKDHTKPLVGDDVVMESLDPINKLGIIRELLPRKNALIRPQVANVDQVMAVFSVTNPTPSLNLLDRILFHAAFCNLPCMICFNKTELVSEKEWLELRRVYEHASCEILFISAHNLMNIDALRERLAHKTTAVSGPSGVGKSTLINSLQSNVVMETGTLSEKIGRGKHTTRHTQLIYLDKDTYILDTPGFSSLAMLPSAATAREWEDFRLSSYYAEFRPYEEKCRFQPCSHTNEPDCAVKAATDAGEISMVRYRNYCLLDREVKEDFKNLLHSGVKKGKTDTDR
ncbi:MAG: ribosome small subunit-dependent GTPase A [Lachnospiraceae bacterium]|nr:ribosome small subunit-dependent GTPase A [Lachnospiraceae bacterium]